MIPRAAAVLLALVLAWVGAPARVLATPQVTSDLSVGGGARFVPGATPGVFSMALRADVLFGPPGPYVPRVGPFVSVRTDDFNDLVPAAGVSFLVPLTSTTPLVLSVGGAVDLTAPSRAGVLGRLWWGSRSYNYHFAYGLTVGVWVEGRYLPAHGNGTDTADLIAGADFDLEVFSLPFILFYNWVAR